jgi:hypothetical protein
MASTNASSSLIVFFVITTTYFILKSYSKSQSQTKMWTIIYLLLLIVSQFYINLTLTNDICGFNQYGVAFMVTVIPWVIIFGILNLILLMFPSWLSPFSNTIGYLFCVVTGINKFFLNILNDKSTINLVKNKEIIETINHIYTDKSLLINEISLNELPLWWKNMKDANILKSSTNEEDYNTLKKYVKMKDDISEYIWYMLTGGLVTSVSYNYIINSGCKQSVEEMKKRHDEYLEKDEEITNAKKTESDPIVYKSYE